MGPSKLHNPTKDPSNSVPPPLKISKTSRPIKKPPPSPSTPPRPSQQRHPVIIYTHSPKVIHTRPKDFMALVQKLTGLDCPEDGAGHDPGTKPVPPSSVPEKTQPPKAVASAAEDNESSSVVTEEPCMSSSCSVTNYNDVISPCGLVVNFPVLGSNSEEFFCPNQPFYDYNVKNTFLFGGPTDTITPNHITSLNEFRDYRL